MSAFTPPVPIGVIGAGAMGMGVVASLLRSGYPVTVCDVAAAARSEAQGRGARIVPSAAAVAATCPLLIVLVVDAAQMDDVLLGAEGAVAGLAAGHVVMACSTIAPDDVARFADRVAATGATLVDAPVSGGPARAHDGSMSMMVAGPAPTLDRCEPVFAAMAGSVFRVGANAGDGARFKVINNMLAAVNLAAAGEAMALAAKAGLDPALVLEVVRASSGASWIGTDRMTRALAGDYAPRAAVRILAKDVGLAVDLATSQDVPAPLARAAHTAFAATVADGLGERDDAAIYTWNRRQAGLPDA